MTNEEIFMEYVRSFDVSCKSINRKINHSLRVSEICKKIAISLNLNDELIEVAAFIGLVHDIGRFKQWEIYHTYNDLKSVDHAMVGIKILFDNNLIKNFIVDNKYYDIILNAIKCHNEYILDCGLDENSLIMSKILRDADKIDILYMIVNGDVEIEKPSFDITQEVISEFLQKKCIKNKYLNTDSDKILLRFALVFDLNYSFSLNYILNNNYLKLIYKRLENKKVIKPYYEFAQKYLEEGCYGKI